MIGDLATLAVAAAAGAAVGALHLALLWAGARALAGRRPAAAFVGLALARAALVLGALGLAVALGAGAGALLAALAGFIVIRIAATRRARPANGGSAAWK